MLHLLLHNKLLTVPILCSSCANNCSCCEFKITASCPARASYHSISSSALTSLSAPPSCVLLPELYGDIDAPFRAEVWAVICPHHLEWRQASAVTTPWMVFPIITTLPSSGECQLNLGLEIFTDSSFLSS